MYLRFLMQRAELLDILRRAPLEGYDVSFLITDTHLLKYGRQRLLDFTVSGTHCFSVWRVWQAAVLTAAVLGEEGKMGSGSGVRGEIDSAWQGGGPPAHVPAQCRRAVLDIWVPALFLGSPSTL